MPRVAPQAGGGGRTACRAARLRVPASGRFRNFQQLGGAEQFSRGADIGAIADRQLGSATCCAIPGWASERRPGSPRPRKAESGEFRGRAGIDVFVPDDVQLAAEDAAQALDLVRVADDAHRAAGRGAHAPIGRYQRLAHAKEAARTRILVPDLDLAAHAGMLEHAGHRAFEPAAYGDETAFRKLGGELLGQPQVGMALVGCSGRLAARHGAPRGSAAPAWGTARLPSPDAAPSRRPRGKSAPSRPSHRSTDRHEYVAEPVGPGPARAHDEHLARAFGVGFRMSLQKTRSARVYGHRVQHRSHQGSHGHFRPPLPAEPEFATRH